MRSESPFIVLRDRPSPAEHNAALLAAVPRHFDLGRVVRQFGTWAVTTYGVECLTNYYPIPIKRLFRVDGGYGLDQHMATKRWVNMTDFLAAWHEARRYFNPRALPTIQPLPFETITSHQRIQSRGVGNGLRFKILRRDGFRCRLCGATATDGARLVIDHRVPWAKGGKTRPENLWVLCQPCNAGKRDQLLEEGELS